MIIDSRYSIEKLQKYYFSLYFVGFINHNPGARIDLLENFVEHSSHWLAPDFTYKPNWSKYFPTINANTSAINC